MGSEARERLRYRRGLSLLERYARLTVSDLDGWSAGLDELMSRVAGRFGRVEPRRRAGSYVLDPLSPITEQEHGRAFESWLCCHVNWHKSTIWALVKPVVSYIRVGPFL